MENNVSANEVENFKKALYINEDSGEDDIIMQYLEAAKAYVSKAVDPNKDLSQYRQFDFAVQMLAQFWYQNRAIDMEQTPYQVLSMIQQLRAMN